ncbi:hypothetical protein [Poseidonibacter ostreae]|uniref:Uncharacterized protein n=1 Tax=Poseidonibacter ostreae TaxID=2654171 RepID=A0A6L4WZ95_9BACT|nr:hypothetical protein [Poseidonibacter ostreae]KAB7891334.1 hypothetical protein GBG19_00425 [Poseidonibacter ostreae]
MKRDISFFGKILTEFKIGLKDNESEKEIQFLSKLISIGLFFDNRITEEESLFAQEILDKELTEEDSKLAWDSILIHIDKYKNPSTRWEFTKNKEEVIDYIMRTNNYHYAKFLSDLLESDSVSEEEEESFLILKKITDEHERVLVKKKLI